MEDFSRILLDWYARCGRDLPWRRTRDPYRIWLSEVILQQTRVAQGLDYYRRFVERFPDVRALAERLGDLLPGAVFVASMTTDANAQAQAKTAGSLVLAVRLWKTRRADLEQELRICRELGVYVAGVAVIG